ncbi:MAG: hypothetical protein WBG95_05240 [Sulfitobacter sp.]
MDPANNYKVSNTDTRLSATEGVFGEFTVKPADMVPGLKKTFGKGSTLRNAGNKFLKKVPAKDNEGQELTTFEPVIEAISPRSGGSSSAPGSPSLPMPPGPFQPVTGGEVAGSGVSPEAPPATGPFAWANRAVNFVTQGDISANVGFGINSQFDFSSMKNAGKGGYIAAVVGIEIASGIAGAAAGLAVETFADPELEVLDPQAALAGAHIAADVTVMLADVGMAAGFASSYSDIYATGFAAGAARLSPVVKKNLVPGEGKYGSNDFKGARTRIQMATDFGTKTLHTGDRSGDPLKDPV